MKAKKWKSLTFTAGLIALLLGGGCSHSPTEAFNRFCKAVEKEDLEAINELAWKDHRVDLTQAYARDRMLREVRRFQREAKTMEPFYEEFFTEEDPHEGKMNGARVYYFVGEPKRARRGGTTRNIQTATFIKEGRHWKLLDIDD